MLSGLQHFAFCRRQWALIHIEQQWGENIHTAEGDLFHQRAHDAAQSELRGDVLTVRGLRVQSQTLRVSGVCDVVEFHRVTEGGVTLKGRRGLWQVYPVEYKKGSPKVYGDVNADAVQLCAQAMCLEEMLCCEIAEGSLFYGETHRRQQVELTDELRGQVKSMLEEMYEYQRRGYTPKAKPNKGCRSCSLADICLPQIEKKRSVKAYLSQRLKEEAP